MEELSCLINRLEEIGQNSSELYDTDVKEQMNEALVKIFIKEDDEYQVPASFGMFSESADKAIQQAFKQFQSDFSSKKINYKTKLELLGPNGMTSNNGQIAECFFGEITESSLSGEPKVSTYAWLQYDWVYYLFIVVPGASLFSILIFASASKINNLWYIPLFFVIMFFSFVVGDKLWQFLADRSFRKIENG